MDKAIQKSKKREESSFQGANKKLSRRAIVGTILFFLAQTFFGIQMGASSSVTPEMMEAAQSTEAISKIQLYFNEIWNFFKNH